MVHHARHLDHAAQLEFAPLAARDGSTQRLHQVRGLGAQLLAGIQKLGHLLHQALIRALARHLQRLHFGFEFLQRVAHRRNRRVRQLHELLGVALERVRGKRAERIRKRRLRLFEEPLLFFEPPPFRLDGRRERLLLSRALQYGLLMAQDGLLAVLERLFQVRYALRQGLERRSAARFDAQLVQGRNPFLVDLLKARARFS